MLRVVAIETVHSSLSPGQTFLTKGKIYEVLGQCSSTYNIIDDTGCRANYWKDRFNPLDCGICSDRRCNSCIVDKERMESIKRGLEDAKAGESRKIKT